MAADWYYVINEKQAGPVELQALRDMLGARTLAGDDLVFGPGMKEWIVAAKAPELNAGPAPASAMTPAAPLAASAATLSYRDVETAATGLSDVAMQLLRQTMPWARFMAIITWLWAGLFIVAALGTLVTAASAGHAGDPPAALGFVYLVIGGATIVPGILLNRYARGIGELLRSRRMTDAEYALGAQKSFWRFVGIAVIFVHAVFIGVFVFTRGQL